MGGNRSKSVLSNSNSLEKIGSETPLHAALKSDVSFVNKRKNVTRILENKIDLHHSTTKHPNYLFAAFENGYLESEFIHTMVNGKVNLVKKTENGDNVLHSYLISWLLLTKKTEKFVDPVTLISKKTGFWLLVPSF